MDKMTVFTLLSDCVNDLERQVWDMEHSSKKLALEAIILRLDAIVDNVVEIHEPLYVEGN